MTCRTGPRSSALIYLYAGLQAGAPAEDVFARAEADDAAFLKSDELRRPGSPTVSSSCPERTSR